MKTYLPLLLIFSFTVAFAAPSCTLFEALTGDKKKDKTPKIDTSEINAFLGQRAPQTHKEMSIYSGNVDVVSSACAPMQKRDNACMTKVHTRAREYWLQGMDTLLKDGDGENAHWAGRWLMGWLFKTWYNAPWWAASFDIPRHRMEKASDLEAAVLSKTWAARKNYAKANSAECVPTASPLPARGTELKPEFLFKPGDDVHVRCYYSKSLNDFSEGMKDARLEVRINISANKQPKGKKTTITIPVQKLANQDYFDYTVSLADQAKGSTYGYASTEAVFVHVTGYKKEYDKLKDKMILVPITADLFTPMSFSFAK
jgi:hypothetical protein